MSVKKIVTMVVSLLICLAFAGCNAQKLESLDFDYKNNPFLQVQSITDELAPWLQQVVKTAQNPEIQTKDWGDYTYYVLTMGIQSVKGGILEITKNKTESGNWDVAVEYVYDRQKAVEQSSDAHYVILKLEKGKMLNVRLVDGITKANLASLRSM